MREAMRVASGTQLGAGTGTGSPVLADCCFRYAANNRPFRAVGRSAIRLRPAGPTCARHGVLGGQLDTSARVIWAFEKLGWVYDVRWPVRERIQDRLVANRV